MNNGQVQSNTLSTWQQLSFIISTLIGMGVLTLPRGVSGTLKEVGWLAPLIGGILTILMLLLIVWLSIRFPGLTFIQYSKLVWGSKRVPWLGTVLSFPWILLFLGYQYVAAGFTARVFGEVVVTAVLLETPLEAVIITMFILVLVLCFHDVEVVVRINELLLPLIVLPVLLIALTSFQTAEWNNLLPFTATWQDFFQAGFESSTAFAGYELMIIFFAFAMPGSNKVKASWYGIAVPTLVYILIVTAGIAAFGYEELQRMIWPTLELVKTTQVPGLILERLESAFLAVWVTAVFTSVGNTYYVTIYALKQWLGMGMTFQRIFSFFLLIPLFFIALVPKNIVEVFAWGEDLSYAGYFVTMLMPVVYSIVTIARYGWGNSPVKVK